MSSNFNRRNFLKTASLGAAAVAMRPFSSIADEKNPESEAFQNSGIEI